MTDDHAMWVARTEACLLAITDGGASVAEQTIKVALAE